MRTIKFRAIVPINQDTPKEMRYYDLSKIDDLDRLSVEDWSIDNIMQFTGLPDKNGKEIYEWDILFDGKYYWEVSWNNDHACFQVKTENAIAEIIDNQNMIIKGNIHQSPELL